MLYSDENLEGCEIELEAIPADIQSWIEIEKHIEELTDRQEALRDDIWCMHRRMDDDGFDGDFDPCAGMRLAIADLDFAIAGHQNKMDEMEKTFSPESKAIHERMQEYDQECAQDAAEDRAVRRAENGYRE